MAKVKQDLVSQPALRLTPEEFIVFINNLKDGTIVNVTMDEPSRKGEDADGE